MRYISRYVEFYEHSVHNCRINVTPSPSCLSAVTRGQPLKPLIITKISRRTVPSELCTTYYNYVNISFVISESASVYDCAFLRARSDVLTATQMNSPVAVCTGIKNLLIYTASYSKGENLLICHLCVNYADTKFLD